MITPEAGTGRIRTALASITKLWPEMVTVLGARTTGTIGRSPERVDPVHAHVLDVRLGATTMLTGWAKTVADERGLTPAIATGDVPALTRFLDAHAEWLAQHQAADLAVAELDRAADAIRALVEAEAPKDEQFVGPCTCGQRLHAPRDAASITCPVCSQVLDRQYVRANAHAVVRDQLCTAAEAEQIAAVIGVQVKRNTVTTWARRGRLAAVGTARDGSPAYRWRDVEELAATGTTGRSGQ